MQSATQPSPDSTAPLKTKYVLAVWGKRYIDRFFELAFPTHLAPQNLPFVAEKTDLSFIVLTRKEDVGNFRSQKLFASMEALGAVDFVLIDDLMSHSGVFTVTLTLAFTRAMRTVGDDAVSTCFLFMNADFMLANGTLATAVSRIQEGAAAVLTASPRCVSEEIELELANWPKQPDGSVVVEPRDMVALSLSAPHAMVYTKQPDFQFMHSDQPNQFFWFVDENTLLVRSYLMFMLAVRPNKANYQATSYCDYSLVSDLVDENQVSIISDSDDGFILEMQARVQERETIKLGPLKMDYAVEHLGEWTTPHHRSIAEHTLVCHSAELPRNLDLHKQRAAIYMSSLDNRLPTAVDPHQHPYWWQGVDAWAMHRNEIELPAEIGAFPIGFDSASVGTSHNCEQKSNFKTFPHSKPDTNNAAARLYRTLHPVGILLRTLTRPDGLHGNLSYVHDALRKARTKDQVLVAGTFPDRLSKRLIDAATIVSTCNDLHRVERQARDFKFVFAGIDYSNIDDVVQSVAVAHQVAQYGGEGFVILHFANASIDPYNDFLHEAFSEIDPVHFIHAKTCIHDQSTYNLRSDKLDSSIKTFRAAPDFSALSELVSDTIRLAAPQLKSNATSKFWQGPATPFNGTVIRFKDARYEALED